MTREEAVEVLKERYLTCVGIGLDNHANRVNEALDLAIEALSEKHQLSEETPTMKVDTPTEPTCKKCTDLISREDAIEAIAQQWLFEASVESPYVNDDDIGEYRKLARELLEDIPSADMRGEEE